MVDFIGFYDMPELNKAKVAIYDTGSGQVAMVAYMKDMDEKLREMVLDEDVFQLVNVTDRISPELASPVTVPLPSIIPATLEDMEAVLDKRAQFLDAAFTKYMQLLVADHVLKEAAQGGWSSIDPKYLRKADKALAEIRDTVEKSLTAAY